MSLSNADGLVFMPSSIFFFLRGGTISNNAMIGWVISKISRTNKNVNVYLLLPANFFPVNWDTLTGRSQEVLRTIYPQSRGYMSQTNPPFVIILSFSTIGCPHVIHPSQRSYDHLENFVLLDTDRPSYAQYARR